MSSLTLKDNSDYDVNNSTTTDTKLGRRQLWRRNQQQVVVNESYCNKPDLANVLHSYSLDRNSDQLERINWGCLILFNIIHGKVYHLDATYLVCHPNNMTLHSFCIKEA